MRSSIAERLLGQTGHDLDWWKARIEERPEAENEVSLRAWLAANQVTGYQQMLLVMERFGYPDYLLASAEELLDAQYRDRADLRPVLDAVLAAASEIGAVEVQARKTYVSLLTPRRTFAAVRPTTRSRIDLVVRLDGVEPEGRLLDGRNSAGGGLNLRLELRSIDDLDDEAVRVLERAYRASL